MTLGLDASGGVRVTLSGVFVANAPWAQSAKPMADVREAAFVEMVVEARRAQPAYDGDERLRALIERTLPEARAAGRVPAGVGIDDVLLAWRMVFGVVATAESAPQARADVARVVAFFDPSR